MARKRKTADEKKGGEASWMVTFSDLTTLLLTFFVLLISMSSLDSRKLESAFRNFDESTGVLMFKDDDMVIITKDMAIQDLCKSLESAESFDIKDISEITSDQTGSRKEYQEPVPFGTGIWLNKGAEQTKFSFIFSDKLMFESASSTLSQRAHGILQKLADFIGRSDYSARIDGHTDDLPIHNEQFTSNEQLSMARAQAVLDHLVKQCDVDPAKLAMGGYGSTHPMVSNDTAEGRAMNRRVEIIFEKTD